MRCDASSQHHAAVPSGTPGASCCVTCNSCNWSVTRQLFPTINSPEIRLGLGLVSETTCGNTGQTTTGPEEPVMAATSGPLLFKAGNQL